MGYDCKIDYMGSCVGNNEDFVNAIMDKAIMITYRTFVKHVHRYRKCTVKDLFPVYDWGKPGLHIQDDYAVSFHRSIWKGCFVYIIRHSSIEYFFRENK